MLGRDAPITSARSTPSVATGRSVTEMTTAKTEAGDLVQAAAAAAGVHIATVPGELIDNIFAEADAALDGPTPSPLVSETPRV